MGMKKSNISGRSQGIEKLAEEGFISNLVENANRRTNKYVWSFNMGTISFYHDEKETIRDFTKYRIRVEYRPQKKPVKRIRVFIEEPLIERKKHFWRDGSLCLYKHSNFQWKKGMTIRNDLFPSICTWLYHYEVWLKTGEWYGEEAEH